MRPLSRPAGRTASQRSGGALVLLGLAAVWLLWDAVLGGKILAPGDLTLFAVPPFSSERPAGLARAANPSLTDIVFVIEPYLLHARERGSRLRHHTHTARRIVTRIAKCSC